MPGSGESCGGVKNKIRGVYPEGKEPLPVGVRSVKTPYGERFVHLGSGFGFVYFFLGARPGPVEFQVARALEAAKSKSPGVHAKTAEISRLL